MIPIRHRRTYLLICLIVIGSMLANGLVLTGGAQADSGRDPIFGARLGDVPGWLEMFDTTAQIYSEYDLAGLAGHLIIYGLADASGCPDGGLYATGLATKCGIRKAGPAMYEWQNRFNAAIVKTSRDTSVPPILLKNIFAWESQFWPKTVFVNTNEYGLGHITEMGADSALRWNAPFYDAICNGYLSRDTCRKKTYADQPASVRATLRGVVIQLARADCADCAYGLNLPLIERSTNIFANTLLANASFVKSYVTYMSGRDAARVVSYEDLWKFTLVSYNAGPGCFVNALSETLNVREDLDWNHLSSHLDLACQGAIPYVDFIRKSNHYYPERDPGRIPTQIPIPTNTVASTAIPTDDVPGVALTPTPEAESTATPEITPTFTGTAEGTQTPIGTEVTATMEGIGTATPIVEITGTLPSPTATLMVPVTDLPSSPTATSTLLVPPTATSTLVVPPTTTATPLVQPTATAGSVRRLLQAPHVADEIVVQIDAEHRSTVVQALRSLGITLAANSRPVKGTNSLVIEVPPVKLEAALTVLQESGLEIAEPNYLVEISGLPNDPYVYQQTGLWPMQVPQAWDALNSSEEVIVAVIDTGVDLNHPDLVDSLWQNPGEIPGNGQDDDGNGYVDDWQGWNVIAGNNDVSDSQGHGTHLAGIIGASANNSTGIAGIAPNARILPVKALDSRGLGSYSQVAEAVVYAVNMGARVINLGFAGTGSSEMLQNAIDFAAARGVLVVAAAGNGGNDIITYPAGYPGVIAAASVDDRLSWAPFSSFGEHVSLVAPGVGILSAFPDGKYGTMSGTSMSAAGVSGVAALLAGQPQFADANTLRSALLGGAYDLGQPGRDPYFGYGVVHALDSLAYVGPILPTPTPWIVPTSTPGGPGGVFVMASSDLWAVSSQTFPPAPVFTHANDTGSIDAAFNDAAASVTGPLAGSTAYRWTFPSLEDTTLPGIVMAKLDLRFYVDGYVDDGYRVEIRQGSFWQTVARLRPETNYLPVPSTMTTMTFDVSTLINTPALVNGAQVRLSGDVVGANGTAETVTVYIDGIRLRVWDSLPTPTPTALFMPTATLQARAITATPKASEPHNNFTLNNTDTCSTCHRSHAAQSFVLRTEKTEEKVCFTCHTTGGSGTNVQPAFTLKSNTTTRFFSHTVFDSVNIHEQGENVGSLFSGVNRHVECEDCHSAHNSSREAASATNPAPLTQQEMYNSTGVDPIWTAAGAPGSFTWLVQADREYQVCFKCHSSFAGLPAYQPDGYGWDGTSAAPGYVPDGLGKLENNSGAQIPDSRDLAKEFNSYQPSFHPVAALGRNRSMPAGSFVSGWSQDSVVYCSSCHENSNAPTNGDGPHGSDLLHILSGSTEYITKIDPGGSCTLDPDGCPFIQDPGQLCFQCHQYGSYASGANPPSTTNYRNGSTNLHSLHSFSACYTCHDTHGSEQQHLINFDTSVLDILPGYNSQSAWQWNGSQGTCYIACHGSTHGNVTRFKYTP